MATPAAAPKEQQQRRPQSSQQTTVSVSFGEDTMRGRFQFEVSECVETKTVTTKTVTKRSFPPVFVQEPRPLALLDAKEYPLATKPTPPELAKISFDVDSLAYLDAFNGGSASSPSPALSRSLKRRPAEKPAPAFLKTDLVDDAPEPIPHALPKTPSELYTRRARRASLRGASPTASVALSRQAQKNTRSTTLGLPGNSDKLRRHVTVTAPRREPGRPARSGPSVLITPDVSAISGLGSEGGFKPRSTGYEGIAHTPDTGTSQSTFSGYDDAASPTASESHTVYSNVATPPIVDGDAEPFGEDDESYQQSLRGFRPRPTVDIVAAQDASLPSPRLSPTLAAARLSNHDQVDDDDDEASLSRPTVPEHGQWPESQTTEEGDSQIPMSIDTSSTGQASPDDKSVGMLSMLESFDSMADEMKTFMMYQFLRRCPRKTLRVLANAINPAMKCDFVKQLPLELAYHILGYLDHRDLCRAAQVSKHWRTIVDSNETGWKELFDRDGFKLPAGELQRAIDEGWGWQDPVGPEGCEVNLSTHNRLTEPEEQLTRLVPKQESVLRKSKRKRGLNNLTSDRSKRRASAMEAPRSSVLDEEVRQHKSEGPLSAASAAARAVTDPQLGLPSLRRLHLFKSIYRRHYMIRQGWTSGKVKPSHVAFTAHPRHVITCLQFDEDKIITGSDDTFIHVYDTKTGKLRKRLDGHEGGVWALQYEGNMLVSGSTDRSVRVWDIEKGLCTQVFYGHTSTVRCLQILMPTETGKGRDGRAVMTPQKPLIITGSRDSQLRVWRLPEPGSRRYIQTGPPANETDCPYFIRTLSGHTHSVRAISAHGDTLVSGSYDSTVRVWRISTGEALHVLHGHTQKVYSVVLDHERNRCISGSMDSLVKIWDLETGACLFTLEGHSLLVGLLDLRDERLVSAAADSTLRIWDPENGKCKSVLTAHTGAITCFQHDGRKVISGSEKTVKMWDIASGDCIQDLLTDLSGVWQVKFDDRRCVAAVQRENNLTYVEILDFGAVRDGVPPEELGRRKLLNEPEVRQLLEEEL